VKPDAAMRANPAVFDLALVQELNRRRPRNVQHVRRLPSSEFGTHGNYRDGIVSRHFFKDAYQ